MDKGQYWDTAALASALATCEEVLGGKMSIAVAPGGTGVIEVTLHEHGDLPVIVGVAGIEIQASVALVPVDEIVNSAVFEHRLLRANKLLPLSTFGITDIDGREYYEIFGQLSAGSELEEIVEELEALGQNAIDAAEMIEAWKAGQTE